MIIIADGGSTKTTWSLTDKEGRKTTFTTEGYNPYFVDTEYIIDSLKKGLPKDLSLKEILEVNFYGAGVHNKEKAEIVANALKVVYPHSKVFVWHDMLAAARALLGTKPGFAAILGTGTNTCLYDGEDITLSIDSAAYILGDEGSGCYIGKKLLVDYLRGYMPKEVHQKFWETYKLDSNQINDEVYTKPLANRFCASFSKFTFDVQTDYTRNIVKTSFEDFFRNLVSHYPDYRSHKFNCIGTVGFIFKDILEEVASSFGMEMGKIVRSPIDSLVEYHLEQLSS